MPEVADIERTDTGLEIAVIGMSGRFPAAENVEQFWSNLVDGVDAVSRFSDDELLGVGISREALSDEKYIRAKGVFPNIEFFDSAFFNYTPADATVLDPQVRALHEEVYHALEDAGYSAEERSEAIGLFLGATNNVAWESHTLLRYIQQSGVTFTGMQLNDKDFAATRIAYALNLKGPAFTLHTACSTSLVAIDMACRNLWTGACQIALAGGSGLTLPHKKGYVYQENMIHSPDGHCRAFDKDAGGTVEGNGAGVVVLKRLETARRDGDHVYAVIKGSAVNNDGNRKVGYTAPSIDGQAEVIRKAYRVANIPPSAVSYVEAHGTGTSLGDPIEVEALRKAFGPGAAPGTVGIGSLKASIGHLDTAAGVASFIKTCKVLEQRQVPRSLHFTELNPNVSLDGSPFYVVSEAAQLERRPSTGTSVLPLRAGVSAFGIGGSNAHVVLEEAPPSEPVSGHGRRYNTFVVSAASAEAIRRIKENFVDHLSAQPDLDGADIAWTLQNRQRRLSFRYAVEFTDAEHLRDRLQESLDADEEPVKLEKNAPKDVYFLFSGLGAQHLGMARGLYDTEPTFRDHIDRCFSISESLGNAVPRRVFFGDSAAADEQLNSIETTQILLFMLEYSMAQTLIRWGVRPRGMIGHSTGELAAACVSGVFSLEDGIRLVHARGALMDATPEGALTTVKAPESLVRSMLTDELALAAVNGPEDCSVSGTTSAVAEFERRCAEEEIGFTHVQADHAYHSPYMESILDKFREVAEQLNFNAPTIPYVSNVTGAWITPEQARDPGYYCAHVRDTVRFAGGVETILERGDAVFVEVGPGKSLSSFVRSIGRDVGVTSINMLRHRMEEIGDDEHLSRAVKKLWEAGVALDWMAFHEGRNPQKVTLPLYPFDRVEYPVDVDEFQRLLDGPDGSPHVPTAARAPRIVSGPAADDASHPALRLVWSRSVLPESSGKDTPRVLIVFTDDAAKAAHVVGETPHWRALYVTFGDTYRFRGHLGAVIRSNHGGDLKRLVADLEDHALMGDVFVLHRENDESLTRLMSGLCAVIPDMRAPVSDLMVLDISDALRRRADLLSRLIGLNVQYPQLRVKALRCETEAGGGRAAQDAWRKCLRRELDAEPTADVAVRYDGGRRFVPLMVPLHGRRVSNAARARRTVIVCRAGDLADAAATAEDATRRVRVVPYAHESDTTPARLSVGDRVAVDPSVTGPTWDAVADGLAMRLRDLTEVDEVVLWDAAPAPTTTGGAVDALDRVVRRMLVDRMRTVGRERGIAVHVLSRPNLDRHEWTGDVTDWFAENEMIDAELGSLRVYALTRLSDGDRSVLDLLPQLEEAGIRTAYHGLDLLDVQAAAKVVRGDDDAGSADERQTVAMMIERELVSLLGFDAINPRTDMFDLGLDSVKLVQFTGALEKSGYKVLASDVYNHPTVAGLAGFISRAAKKIGHDGGSFDSVATLLGERLDTTCAYHEFRPRPEDDSRVLLFVDGLDDDLRRRVVREINDLRLPGEYVPHHVLPLTMEKSFLAGDVTSLGASRAIGAAPIDDLESVFAEIDRLQDDVRSSIGAQPVKWTYPISAMQKHHFASDARLQLYLIQFRELVDVDVLQRALCDVVGRHGLMRSFLTKSFGRFRWKEFDAPTSFAVPQVDLSGLEPRRQEELRAALVKREWNIDFKVVDKPMYQAVLLKYNERSYDLLFQFDHSIFDAASGQTLRADLLKRYEELSAGSTRAMPPALSFKHLQDQILKGPVGITPDEIIDKLELKQWSHYGKEIQVNAARYQNNPICDIRYSVDLRAMQDEAGGDVESFSLVVHLFARLVSRLLDVDKVALDMLFQSREYEDKDYSDVMGMVLGSLPIVISGGRGARDDLEAVIRDKFRLVNKHNISFLNLIHDLRSMLKYGKVFTATKAARGDSFRPSCLLNFVGNVEDEYDAIWDMTLEQLTDDQSKLDYADFYCVSKINKGRLDLLILTKWAEDPDDITTILDDEVEFLTQNAAAGVA